MAQAQVPAATAGRPLPQTTTREAAGGVPFVALARKASRVGYAHAGLAFAGAAADALPQAPGYARRILLRIQGTGGTGASTFTTDATASAATIVQNIQLKDGFGTPIFSGSGFGLLYLDPLVSGQYGLIKAADITQQPSYAAFNATGGNFNVWLPLPLEITPGYGCMSIGNASALPSLLVNLNTSGAIFASGPTAAPSLEVDAEVQYFEVDDPTVQPEGLGTTLQHIEAPATPPFGAAASLRLQCPHTAGYLRHMIVVVRDSTGARVDVYGARVRLWIDGFPLRDQQLQDLTDEFYRFNGGNVTRPTGVIAYRFGDSLSQVNLGSLDTLLECIPITPATQIEVECTPWGSGGTPPYTATIIYGVIVPKGPLATGLPEAVAIGA
jgi:hypothetical protein